jgi:DNA repair photolyase
MNIYRGCQFACAYCDGMSEYYHVDNYTSHVRAKTNAPEILRKELKKILSSKPRKTLDDYSIGERDPKRPIIGISGGVSDSYQQAEKKYRITEKVLQVILEYRLPVFLLTKSDLVLRDIELLKEINETAFASVCFSIAWPEDGVKSKLEPYSPPIDLRLDAMKELRGEGIRGGVMAMPIVPFIGDSKEDMTKIARQCRDHKAEFVLFSGMTLKPGRQKTYFLNTIKKHFPEKLNEIRNCYSNNNTYGVPRDGAALNPSMMGPSICEEVGVPWLSIRHGCPNEYDTNLLVQRKLLESNYMDSWLLQTPRKEWEHRHQFAVNLERGLPDLSILLEKNNLADRHGVSENFRIELREILEKDTSYKIEEKRKQVLDVSNNYLRKIEIK